MNPPDPQVPNQKWAEGASSHGITSYSVAPSKRINLLIIERLIFFKVLNFLFKVKIV